MSKKIIFALFMLCMTNSYAHAKASLLSFGGEHIVKVVELPDEKIFQYKTGEYIDIGYMYKSVSVLFIPIWNYDGMLVGMAGNGRYLKLNDSTLNTIITLADKELPEKPYLSFWQRIGGKLAFLAILFYFGNLFRRWFKLKQQQDAYQSNRTTTLERLKDILVNGQGFVELDPAILEIGHNDKVDYLDFIGTRGYYNSFITVSIFDMNKLSIAQVQSNNDSFFKKLLDLRKTVGIKPLSSIHYMYFVFDKSPNEEERALLKKLKKKKIIGGTTNALPIIIDIEKQDAGLGFGATPSKSIIQHCFTQANKAPII